MTPKLRAPWTMYTSTDERYADGYRYRLTAPTYHNVPTLAIQYDPELPYLGDGRRWKWKDYPVVADGVPMDGWVRVRGTGSPFLAHICDLTEIPSRMKRGPERRRNGIMTVAVDMSPGLCRRETERRKDWPEGGR